MKFGVGVDYCLKAMIVLAERYPNPQPLRVEEIAAAQSIPENYLRRLLIELKRGGLVASQKGPSGGYLLARHPAKITMADVVQIIEGDFAPVECLEENSNSPFKGLDNLEALRKSGMFAVWTADELVANAHLVEDQGTFSLQPLVGGFPPEEGWKSLKLLKDAIPRLKALQR